MVAQATIIAILVAALTVLYVIALTGDHPLLTKYLRGSGADRSDSLTIRILVTVVGLGAFVYAIFFFDGEFGAPVGTIRWWLGVAGAIFAVVFVGRSMIRDVMK